jgi:hypothetical protein
MLNGYEVLNPLHFRYFHCRGLCSAHLGSLGLEEAKIYVFSSPRAPGRESRCPKHNMFHQFQGLKKLCNTPLCLMI